MNKKVEVYIQDDMTSFNTGIFIYMKDEQTGRVFKCKPMLMEFEDITNQNNVGPFEPSLKFNYRQGKEFLTGLAQALEGSGYRDKSTSKDGEIKRMTDHLEDMRKIAFTFIKEK